MSKHPVNSPEPAVVDLQARIDDAVKNNKRLKICGSNSKSFLYPGAATSDGMPPEDLYVDYPGVVSYQPSELVLSVRASTGLDEIHATLEEQHQMLGFEPPALGDAASIGGTVAAGLSGCARPYAGSIRDAVLGIKMLTGRGELVRFGGEVMKNVAGYDVSRLLVGSMGSLGVILEVSMRVTPQLPAQAYLHVRCNEDEAFEEMLRLRKLSLPISGLAYDGEHLHVRLAGSEIAINESSPSLADFVPEDANFWQQLNEQKLAFFADAKNLWRIVVPLDRSIGSRLHGDRIWDWGGGLCWLKSDEPAAAIHRAAKEVHGSARLFKGSAVAGEETMVAEPVRAIRARLKQVFDPHAVFAGHGLW